MAYEKIIERIIRGQIGDLREQHGFRSGRSTMDLIFAVRQLQERCYEYWKDLIIAFMEMDKMCDSVGRYWEGREWWKL